MTENPTAWAQPADIAGVWRPLSDTEADRATNLIAQVERAIRRRWPDSARDRLIVPGLKDSITDVLVWSVIPMLEQDPASATAIPSNAKSFQQTSGTESVSVTLDGSLGGRVMTFDPWMVDVFDGGAQDSDRYDAGPAFSFPPAEDLGVDWLGPGGRYRRGSAL